MLHRNNAYVVKTAFGEPKTFAYSRDRASSDKHRAEAEARAYESSLRNAANSRSMAERGKPVTDREFFVEGFRAPSTLTKTEQLRSEIVTKGQPTGRDANPYTQRVQELEYEMSHAHPRDHGPIKRRLDIAVKARDTLDVRIQDTQRQNDYMASEPVQTAIVDAKASLALLTVNHSIPQEYIDRAAKRLADLQATGDTENYWGATRAAESEVGAIKAARVKALQTQAAETFGLAERQRAQDSAEVAAKAAEVAALTPAPVVAEPEVVADGA